MSSTRRPPAGRSPRQRRPRAPEDRAAAEPRSRRSDLMARVLVAIPAAIVALIFVDVGGLAFALFMIAVGWVCMHELWGLLQRWRPVAIVGFASLAAMVIAARYGAPRTVLFITMATFPVLFLTTLLRGHGGITISVAGTLLGIVWLGL